MKKVICIILILCISPVICLAEVDLSGMTYKELVSLRDQINLAIWNSQEWQEVTVPQGEWEVGKDIPAGTWTVHCAVAHYGMVRITNGGSYKESEVLTSPDYKNYKKGVDVSEYSFTVEDGDVIIITDCDMVFTPYAGKPDLGFK